MKYWEAQRWWDQESVFDERYATQRWGGDGSEEQIDPTIDKIIVNLDGVLFASNAHRIVEIGCGPGRLLHRLANRRPDRQFYGVDISPMMLDLGRWNRPSNVEVYVRPEFPPTPVDMVYSVEVFQHLEPGEKRDYLTSIAAWIGDWGIAVIQFVRGDPLEASMMNFPEYQTDMAIWAKEVGLRVRDDYKHLHPVHDNWSWMVVSK